MTQALQSYDENGPLIPLGLVKLWLMHDPLGIRKMVRYDFDLDLWLLAQTESVAVVCVPGQEKPIKQGSIYNDFYGFGTSREKDVLSDAGRYLSQFSGANLDVKVETTLTLSAVAHDPEKPPFYRGAVRCFHLPPYWWKTQSSDQGLSEAFGKTERVTIWRNGGSTPEAEELQRRIDELRGQDGAAHLRNGDLR